MKSINIFCICAALLVMQHSVFGQAGSTTPVSGPVVSNAPDHVFNPETRFLVSPNTMSSLDYDHDSQRVNGGTRFDAKGFLKDVHFVEGVTDFDVSAPPVAPDLTGQTTPDITVPIADSETIYQSYPNGYCMLWIIDNGQWNRISICTPFDANNIELLFDSISELEAFDVTEFDKFLATLPTAPQITLIATVRAYNGIDGNGLPLDRGGGKFYLDEVANIPDGGRYFTATGNIAKRWIRDYDGEMHVEQWGSKPNDDTFDSSEVVQAMLDNIKYAKFLDGNYYLGPNSITASTANIIQMDGGEKIYGLGHGLSHVFVMDNTYNTVVGDGFKKRTAFVSRDVFSGSDPRIILRDFHCDLNADGSTEDDGVVNFFWTASALMIATGLEVEGFKGGGFSECFVFFPSEERTGTIPNATNSPNYAARSIITDNWIHSPDIDTTSGDDGSPEISVIQTDSHFNTTVSPNDFTGGLVIANNTISNCWWIPASNPHPELPGYVQESKIIAFNIGGHSGVIEGNTAKDVGGAMFFINSFSENGSLIISGNQGYDVSKFFTIAVTGDPDIQFSNISVHGNQAFIGAGTSRGIPTTSSYFSGLTCFADTSGAMLKRFHFYDNICQIPTLTELNAQTGTALVNAPAIIDFNLNGVAYENWSIRDNTWLLGEDGETDWTESEFFGRAPIQIRSVHIPDFRELRFSGNVDGMGNVTPINFINSGGAGQEIHGIIGSAIGNIGSFSEIYTSRQTIFHEECLGTPHLGSHNWVRANTAVLAGSTITQLAGDAVRNLPGVDGAWQFDLLGASGTDESLSLMTSGTIVSGPTSYSYEMDVGAWINVGNFSYVCFGLFDDRDFNSCQNGVFIAIRQTGAHLVIRDGGVQTALPTNGLVISGTTQKWNDFRLFVRDDWSEATASLVRDNGTTDSRVHFFDHTSTATANRLFADGTELFFGVNAFRNDLAGTARFFIKDMTLKKVRTKTPTP